MACTYGCDDWPGGGCSSKLVIHGNLNISSTVQLFGNLNLLEGDMKLGSADIITAGDLVRKPGPDQRDEMQVD